MSHIGNPGMALGGCPIPDVEVVERLAVTSLLISPLSPDTGKKRKRDYGNNGLTHLPITLDPLH